MSNVLALVPPTVIARWLGPPGWRPAEAVFEAHPGGPIRFSWSAPGGVSTFQGTVLDLSPPRLIRQVARGLPGCADARVEMEIRLSPEATGTRATFFLTLDTPSGRNAALDGPMPERMEARFLALDEVMRS